MLDAMLLKIDVAVNMTCAHTLFYPANANVVYAINNRLHDRIVIVMQNFAGVYKDLILVTYMLFSYCYFSSNFQNKLIHMFCGWRESMKKILVYA